MIIGLPKEIKSNENRVGLTPGGVATLIKSGHTVFVEKSAGAGSGFEDALYEKAGALIVTDKQKLFDDAQIIVKVKEPLASEYELFHAGQILYTYLHLAPNAALTKALLDKKVVGIAYETVQLPNGALPLLTPMSEVAGRMATQVGANLLLKYNGGSGTLLGGVPGVAAGHVMVLGAGVVGTNAAKMAIGLGAKVTILDISKPRLQYLDDIFGGRLQTLVASEYNIHETAKTADVLVSAVLVFGAAAPKLVKEYMVKDMKKGSVIVDVAIDQGGAVETADRVTTHDNPSFEKHGVVHYTVANMPGAVPRTSTLALEAATLPYLVTICNLGYKEALKADPALMLGLNTYDGKVTCEPVAKDLGYPYVDPRTLL